MAAAINRLDGLPVEILDGILSWLCFHCVSASTGRRKFYYSCEDGEKAAVRGMRKGLHSLCLTSKHLRILAEPYLYHLVCDRWGSRSSLLPLATTLTSSPRLARHVQHIELGSTNVGEDFRPELVDHFSNVAARCGLRISAPDWVAHWVGRAMVLNELLLLHIPRVNTVHLDVLRSSSLTHLHTSAMVPEAAPSFPALRTLSADPGESESGLFPLHRLTPLVKGSPGLKNLFIRRGSYLERSLPFPIPSVVNLSLETCIISAIAVAELVKSCDRLEAFNLLYPPPALSGEFDFKRHMLPALQQHVPSLRRLGLDVILDSDWYTIPPEDRPTLSNFGSLETLYTFVRPFPFMVRDLQGQSDDSLVLILPASIRRLYLLDPVSDIISELWGLETAVEAGRFPNLTEIVVNGSTLGPTRQLGGELNSTSDVNVRLASLMAVCSMRPGFRLRVAQSSSPLYEWD